jgi:hypothetical protein
MITEENLRQAIDRTQEAFRAGIGQAGITDVGFIGNTSGVYAWEPALILDIDMCLFVTKKDAVLGHWLLAQRDHLRAALDRLGIDFELKVLRGPYKPAAWQLARPVAIAHLAVFTEDAYAQEPQALRWSWRKYRCVVEPSRLSSDRGQPPGWAELREMATRKRTRIRAERVQMTEWELPEFTTRVWEFDARHPVFVHYCLFFPLLCARTHGRVLGRPESDSLGNRDYVTWYRRELIASAALEEIQRLNARARQHGYANLLPQAREYAETYLDELLQRIPPGA